MNVIAGNSDPSALNEVAGYVEIDTKRIIHEEIAYDKIVRTEPEAEPSTFKSPVKTTMLLLERILE